MLAVDAVGRANNRARPTLQMPDHPGSDRFVIVRQIQLSDWPALTGAGPKDFFRFRDRDAHHDGIIGFPRRWRGTRLRFGAHRAGPSKVRGVALFEFQTASGAFLVLSMKGFGLEPLPAAMSAMVRPEAIDRSSDKSASASF